MTPGLGTTINGTDPIDEKHCRWCEVPITFHSGHWLDNVGGPSCAVARGGCLECADGEPHPHTPPAAPAHKHVVLVLDVAPDTLATPAAVLRNHQAAKSVTHFEVADVYDLVLDHDTWACSRCGCSALLYLATMRAAWTVNPGRDQIRVVGGYRTEGHDEHSFDGHLRCSSCDTRHRLPARIEPTFEP